MAHIFISYSHIDKVYAHKLAQSLLIEGFSIWIDDRIDYGTTWPRVIQENLDACFAFILVMTPHSYESDWVQNELCRALEKKKPVFPLLLEGDDAWLAIQSTQYVDVRSRELPPKSFYERIADILANVSAVKRIQEKHIIGQWIGEDNLGEEIFFHFKENMQVVAGYTENDDKNWQGKYRLVAAGKLINLQIIDARWIHSADDEQNDISFSLSYILKFIDAGKIYLQIFSDGADYPEDISPAESIFLIKKSA